MDFVKSLGGNTSFSGGNPKAEMSDRTQHPILAGLGRKKAKGGYYKQRITVGYRAGRKLVGMLPSEGPTMYVSGLTEEKALILHKKFKHLPLPFKVVFQEKVDSHVNPVPAPAALAQPTA